MTIEQQQQNEMTERMITAYFDISYDRATARFKEAPSANNWQSLKREMAAFQAWRQRSKTSEVQRLPELLAKLWKAPMYTYHELVIDFIHGEGTYKKMSWDE